LGEGTHSVGRREAIVAGCGVVASLLAACATTSGSDQTGVDLNYTKDGRLTGTLAGQPLNLSSRLPGSGTVAGTLSRHPLDASWQIAYGGTPTQKVVPVTLHGKFASQSISLSAVFHLKPNVLFDSGTVTGVSGGRPVRAQASSAPGESSSSVNVDGSFAGTPFSLYATIASTLDSGLVRGTVGGKPIHLTAKAQSGTIAITGNYRGPSELFVLATGSLLYFLGGIYAV
jgi:hypothetical protein